MDLNRFSLFLNHAWLLTSASVFWGILACHVKQSAWVKCYSVIIHKWTFFISVNDSIWNARRAFICNLKQEYLICNSKQEYLIFLHNGWFLGTSSQSNITKQGKETKKWGKKKKKRRKKGFTSSETHSCSCPTTIFSLVPVQSYKLPQSYKLLFKYIFIIIFPEY